MWSDSPDLLFDLCKGLEISAAKIWTGLVRTMTVRKELICFWTLKKRLHMFLCTYKFAECEIS